MIHLLNQHSQTLDLKTLNPIPQTANFPIHHPAPHLPQNNTNHKTTTNNNMPATNEPQIDVLDITPQCETCYTLQYVGQSPFRYSYLRVEALEKPLPELDSSVL
jgi:hypothetical protein